MCVCKHVALLPGLAAAVASNLSLTNLSWAEGEEGRFKRRRLMWTMEITDTANRPTDMAKEAY